VETDVISEYLTHYFSCDLVSAGLKMQELEKVRSNGISLLDKWAILAPWWQAARNTGYGRSLDIAARLLYGIDRIDGDSIETLNERFIQARRKGGHYSRVLKEVSHIRMSILDSDWDCDPEFFRSTVHIDGWVMPQSLADMDALCRKHRLTMTCLSDFVEAVDREIEEGFNKGCACYKCALAYRRSLHYPQATLHEAEKDFQNMLGWRHIRIEDGASISSGEGFQNYMIHHILRRANQAGRIIQFHTGLHEGYGNILNNSDPTLMTNLFLNYPDARFDLFHMSYPFIGKASALAKNFQNVFLDMCWGHIISPTAAVNALVEWLDAVPSNKISAFGGDYCFVDGVAGHMAIARQNVARALAVKVEQGAMDTDGAIRLAEDLFYHNPMRIFNLKACGI
jgi:predicted TIM-barrel fold metal-dependent hydrolase